MSAPESMKGVIIRPSECPQIKYFPPLLCRLIALIRNTGISSKSVVEGSDADADAEATVDDDAMQSIDVFCTDDDDRKDGSVPVEPRRERLPHPRDADANAAWISAAA